MTGFAQRRRKMLTLFDTTTPVWLISEPLAAVQASGKASALAVTLLAKPILAGNVGPHAFFQDGTAMSDLGTLGGSGSRALAVNASDTIVGESTSALGTLHAVVYAAGTIIDLNTVTSGLNGATLTTATAINDAGQIVAMSCTATLVCPRAFRLDPVAAPKVVAIEYHHAAFDHYFVTAIPSASITAPRRHSSSSSSARIDAPRCRDGRARG